MINLAIHLNSTLDSEATQELFGRLTQLDCILLNAQINRFGDRMLAQLLVQGEWSGIAKLETVLKTEYDNAANWHRVKFEKPSQAFVRYELNVFSTPRPEVCSVSLTFLESEGYEIVEQRCHIRIGEISGETAQLTQTVFNLTPDKDLSTLREQVALLCDSLNVDGFIEPERLR